LGQVIEVDSQNPPVLKSRTPNKLSSRTPKWLRDFRVAQVNKIAALALPHARRRLLALRKLGLADAMKQTGALKRMRQFTAQLGVFRVKSSRVNLVVVMALGLPASLAFWASPFVVLVRAHRPWFVPWGFVGSPITAVLLSMLAGGPWYLLKQGSRRTHYLPSIVASVWLVALLMAYAITTYVLLDGGDLMLLSQTQLMSLSALIQFFVYFAAIVMVGALGSSVLYVWPGSFKRKNPVAFFMERVLLVAESIAFDESAWHRVDGKALLMKRLEEAARIVEKDFPDTLRSADFSTDALLKTRFDQIAAALREKKLWIATPKSDTRERLRDWLAHTLESAIEGDWDSLELAERAGRPSRSLREVAISSVRGVFTALGPVAIYWAAKRWDLLPHEDWTQYLGVGVVVWAIFAILFAMDPQLGERIEAFQKLTSIVPGFGKKKD